MVSRATAFGAAALILGLLAIVAVVGELEECHDTARRTGYETSYDFPSGCYIKVDNDRWIPLEKWVNSTEN